MIELQHRFEPKALRDYRKRNLQSSWGSAAFETVRPLVKRQLNAEQEGLCVYCESILDEDDGHIDHIEPRNLRPDLTFVYNNLAHSCDGRGHCGRHKKNRVMPVEPRAGCSRFFTLMALDGRLEPAAGLTPAETQQAIDTCDILGLNAPSLTWQRKGYADAVRALHDPADISAFLAVIPFRWSLRGL